MTCPQCDGDTETVFWHNLHEKIRCPLCGGYGKVGPVRWLGFKIDVLWWRIWNCGEPHFIHKRQ